jgi:hypothetical protein
MWTAYLEKRFNANLEADTNFELTIHWNKKKLVELSTFFHMRCPVNFFLSLRMFMKEITFEE